MSMEQLGRDLSILQKDAKIYSSGEEEGEEKPKTAKKERPLYLKDVMAQHLIEEGPEFGEKPLKNNPKVYNKEQEEGLKAFLEAAEKEVAEAGSEDDGDIIKEKKKGKIPEIEWWDKPWVSW